MSKDKRRMIDADKLKEWTLNYCDVYVHYSDIINQIDKLLKTDSTCSFRNPGWEERAKEHDNG